MKLFGLVGALLFNYIELFLFLQIPCPFIKESMKEYVLLWFQITVAAVLVIVAFYMFLFVCSLSVDFIVILIPLVLSGITSLFSGIISAVTSALGFRMPSERNELTDDSRIPLNSMPSEPEYQLNGCSDNTLEQPSSEHAEHSPGLRREPGQSKECGKQWELIDT